MGKHANTSFIDNTPFDAMFGGIENAPSEKEKEIIENTDGERRDISVKHLYEAKHHTFRVIDDEAMDHLKESIKINGIFYPLIVRADGHGKYEVLSGHRRLYAAKDIGLEKVPCLIADVDDATADIIMVDTNLHREEILPSEKARSYDLRIKAMKEKGLLSEEISGERQYEEMLATDTNSSRVNVYRYRKLLLLKPYLLDQVDKKIISVNAGAKLASLSENQQNIVVDALLETNKSITMEAADKIVSLSDNRSLTKDKVISIIDGKFSPRKRSVSAGNAKNAVKEKNFASVYPASIRTMDSKEKESFIMECIRAYVENNDSWNGISLK